MKVSVDDSCLPIKLDIGDGAELKLTLKASSELLAKLAVAINKATHGTTSENIKADR